MLTGQTLFYLVLVLAAASTILAIEAVYVSYAERRSRAGTINRRLKRLAEEAPAEQTLQGLLRERGLSEIGDFAFGIIALNRLYTQSGTMGNPVAFAAMFIAAGTVIGLLFRLVLGFATIWALPCLS
jgi:tight adherence protein B